MPFDAAEWAPPVVEIDLTKKHRSEADVPFYDTVGRVLIRARNHVVDGWAVGALKRGGRVCVVGAIQSATGILSYPPEGATVMQWNDMLARRQDRVVRLFDRTIDNRRRAHTVLFQKDRAHAAIMALHKQISADIRA